MRPIGRIGDIRSCGAIITFTPNTSVFANDRLIATLGSIDSHGGMAVFSYNSSIIVEGSPAVIVGDLNSGCIGPWPHSGPHPLVTGDYNVIGN